MSLTEQRTLHLERAYLQLLDRMVELERALDFEIRQREAFEALIARLAGVSKRVDRLELLEVERRRAARGVYVKRPAS